MKRRSMLRGVAAVVLGGLLYHTLDLIVASHNHTDHIGGMMIIEANRDGSYIVLNEYSGPTRGAPREAMSE